VLGPSARTASTRARLLADLEPGTATLADTGRSAVGAGHSSFEIAFSDVVITARLSGAAGHGGSRLGATDDGDHHRGRDGDEHGEPHEDRP
jgi:hypothetical protein